MHSFRYLLIALVIAGIMIGAVVCPICAKPLFQPDAPEITVTIASKKVVEGDVTIWYISIIPPADQSLAHIKLCPANPKTWRWVDNVQLSGILTKSVVIPVQAMPRLIGDLMPAITVTYTLSDVEQTRLVVGGSTVHVQSVEDNVQADITTNQGTVQVGDTITAWVQIRNNSPFTLTEIRLRDAGIDLKWQNPPSLDRFAPTEAKYYPLTAKVQGPHPKPRLILEYTWSNSVSKTSTHSIQVTGEALAVEENIMGQIPDELFGILFGIIAGALSTFITGLIAEWRKQKSQYDVNRQHVHGLLNLMVMQSQYAANNGVEIELNPLETLFKEEGLFKILEDENLAQVVRDLWDAAVRHNKGLNLPGGSQRSTELKDVAEGLREKLKLPKRRVKGFTSQLDL